MYNLQCNSKFYTQVIETFYMPWNDRKPKYIYTLPAYEAKNKIMHNKGLLSTRRPQCCGQCL